MSIFAFIFNYLEVCDPSSQSATIFSLFLFCLFFLLSSPNFAFFFTSHFSSIWAPLYIYFIPSPTFSLMSPPFPTLSSSFLCDPAVINRPFFGRWSVRNGRCNARSQLLQVFPGWPRCAALCGARCKPCRENIQNKHMLWNIETALMSAWFTWASR